jgi:SagB-type dehydrogenase family enzyme
VATTPEPVFQLGRYHDATKHSPVSVGLSGHRLDWSIKPLPFKVYRGLEAIEPPRDIGRLCVLSNGVLRWRRDASGEAYGFRAAPCTGALYHTELYVAAAARPDLPAGLYHFGAHDASLRRLRAGDVRGALVAATGPFEPVRSAPLLFVLTSTFWRNSWKYQTRAYRHAFWDGGAVLANLLALLAADGTPTSVLMGFVDDDVNALLGIDGEREAAVAIVAVGDGAEAPSARDSLPDLALATEPLSTREVRYPEIEAAHRASSLASGQEIVAWQQAGGRASPAVPPAISDAPIEDAIRRRRSTRRLERRPITRGQLEGILAAATSAIPGDAFAPLPVEPFLIVNAVEGLEPGLYGPDLGLIRRGRLRWEAGELALGQELGAEAAVNVYFLSDLDAVFERFGERGYRVAQMAGGIAGERLELAATAQNLGATGLTFFDDEVTAFFEPASAGRQVMYLAAVGHSPS